MEEAEESAMKIRDFQFLLGCYVLERLRVARGMVFQFLLGCYKTRSRRLLDEPGSAFNSFWDATTCLAGNNALVTYILSIPFGMLPGQVVTPATVETMLSIPFGMLPSS